MIQNVQNASYVLVYNKSGTKEYESVLKTYDCGNPICLIATSCNNCKQEVQGLFSELHLECVSEYLGIILKLVVIHF